MTTIPFTEKGLGHISSVTWLGIKPDSQHLTHHCSQPAPSANHLGSKHGFSGESSQKDKPLEVLPDVAQ